MLCIPYWFLTVYLMISVFTYWLVKKVRNNGHWTKLDFLICFGMAVLWLPMFFAGLVLFFARIDMDSKSKL